MWKNGHFTATAMPHDTGEQRVMVHINRHYPDFPIPGNILGYLMGESL